MNIKRLTTLFFLLFLSSCSTKQYLIKTCNQDIELKGVVFVIQNDSSFIIPVAIYPKYQIIDDYVINTKPAIDKIELLICNELKKRNINCKIVNDISDIDKDSYYINYQDYWAWDFKKYMHVLKVNLYKSNKKLISVVSQGNTGGMHDYPNPQKQVPLLIELILKNNSVQ